VARNDASSQCSFEVQMVLNSKERAVVSYGDSFAFQLFFEGAPVLIAEGACGVYFAPVVFCDYPEAVWHFALCFDCNLLNIGKTVCSFSPEQVDIFNNQVVLGYHEIIEQQGQEEEPAKTERAKESQEFRHVDVVEVVRAAYQGCGNDDIHSPYCKASH